MIAIFCAILFFAVFFLKIASEYFGYKGNILPQPAFQNSAQIKATSTERVFHPHANALDDKTHYPVAFNSNIDEYRIDVGVNSEEFALRVGAKEIIVSLADTPEKRAKGFMGVDFLEENRGMLFVFENPGQYSFWNKNTLIPLDIIWIRNKKIIKIDYLPSIDKGLKVLDSPEEIDWVLEANAGWSEKNNIKIGDESF